MRKKTPPSASIATIRQFWVSEMRWRGVRNRVAPAPVISPAVTAATNPDAPSSSVGRYARNGTVNEIAVLTAGSWTRARTRRLSIPTTAPIATASTTA